MDNVCKYKVGDLLVRKNLSDEYESMYLLVMGIHEPFASDAGKNKYHIECMSKDRIDMFFSDYLEDNYDVAQNFYAFEYYVDEDLENRDETTVVKKIEKLEKGNYDIYAKLCQLEELVGGLNSKLTSLEPGCFYMKEQKNDTVSIAKAEFPTKEDAKRALSLLRNRLANRGFITIADYMQLSGMRYNPANSFYQKYGWRGLCALNNIVISGHRNKGNGEEIWRLNMPEPTIL